MVPCMNYTCKNQQYFMQTMRLGLCEDLNRYDHQRHELDSSAICQCELVCASVRQNHTLNMIKYENLIVISKVNSWRGA